MMQSPNQTKWSVRWPSTTFKQGKAYIATTYPNSDALFLETAANLRIVSPNVATRITPLIRAAIAKAQEEKS